MGMRNGFFEYFESGLHEASFVDLLIDEEDYIYVIGTEFLNGVNAYLTVFKLDPNGEVVWKNQFDQASSFGGYGRILADRIVVLGQGNQRGSTYILHQISFDGLSLGAIQNEQSDNFQNNLTFDSEGNLYLGDFAGQYKIAKIDLTGDTSWYYELPVIDPPTSGIYARLNSLLVDDNGNVYATGPHFENGSGFGVVTTKINATGEEEWSHRFSHPDLMTNASANGIKFSENFIVVTGEIELDSLSGRDYLLLIYSLDGELLFESIQDFNNHQFEAANSSVILGNDIYITGLSKKSTAASDTTYLLTQRYAINRLFNSDQNRINEFGLSVFPNPFGEQINIICSNDYSCSEVTYKLMNLQGQVLKFGEILEKEESICIKNHLPDGLYFLIFSFEKGDVLVYPLMHWR